MKSPKEIYFAGSVCLKAFEIDGDTLLVTTELEAVAILF
jgi:hypothetical protein